jgi:hypothetical protein
MRNILEFDSYLNEGAKFGTLDGFDQLTDAQKHVALLVYGLFRYNPHLSAKLVRAKDGNAVITIGDGTGKDPQAAKLVKFLMDLISDDEELTSIVDHEKGTGIIKLSK